MNFEPTMLEAFKENPIFFALAVLIGAVGFVLLLVALIALGKKPGLAGGLGFAAAVAGVLTVGAGTMGWFSARAHTLGAVSAPGLSARDRERILAYGNAEAAMPFKFGAGLGALPLLAGIALGAAGISRARKK